MPGHQSARWCGSARNAQTSARAASSSRDASRSHSRERREELRAAEHALELLAALVGVERLDARVRRVARDLLDAEVAVGEARDLRQVRDRDDLRAVGEAAQRLADGVRGLAADAGVDLVEHHRLAAADGRDRERDPRQLAARRGLGDRPERQAGVRPDEERRPRRRPTAPGSAARSSARNSPSPRPTPASSAATASANARRGRARAPRAARRGAGRPRPARARAPRPPRAPGSWPSSSAASSRRASVGALEQLVVASAAR